MRRETYLKYCEWKSPLGPVTVIAVREGIAALVFEGQKYAEVHVIYARSQENPASAPEGDDLFFLTASRQGRQGTEEDWLEEARRWLKGYFDGSPDLTLPPLSPRGTAYQRRVWEALLSVPRGTVTTYGAVAEKCGGSPKAVGSAVGRNPVSLMIPCHRIVGADGSLTGYAGGLERKQKLLEWEGAVPEKTGSQNRMKTKSDNGVIR